MQIFFLLALRKCCLVTRHRCLPHSMWFLSIIIIGFRILVVANSTKLQKDHLCLKRIMTLILGSIQIKI